MKEIKKDLEDLDFETKPEDALAEAKRRLAVSFILKRITVRSLSLSLFPYTIFTAIKIFGQRALPMKINGIQRWPAISVFNANTG